MIVDWNQPFTLLSPYGSIPLNDPATSVGYYILIKDGCTIGPSVRAQEDNIPQGDGSILHRRWLTGTQATLAIQIWSDPEDPACDEELQLLYDELILHARGLLNAGDNEGRLLWTPAGQATRMLDDIRLLEYPRVTFSDNLPQVEFQIDTVYPYAIDLTQIATVVNDGGTELLNNTGTAEYWPVFLVDGLTNDFVITNVTLDFSIIYSSSFPGAQTIGGGDYAEINTFRNTVYLNGDQDNLKPGIDVQNSDFFPLGPGENQITITGASMTVLWQAAWG